MQHSSLDWCAVGATSRRRSTQIQAGTIINRRARRRLTVNDAWMLFATRQRSQSCLAMLWPWSGHTLQRRRQEVLACGAAARKEPFQRRNATITSNSRDGCAWNHWQWHVTDIYLQSLLLPIEALAIVAATCMISYIDEESEPCHYTHTSDVWRSLFIIQLLFFF